MLVLGLSAFYHDSAAALIEDGRVIAAAQEERFSRKKFDERFPRLAIEWCLRSRGISLRELDYIAFYDKPFLKFERLLETYLAFAPHGVKSYLKAMPVWLGEKLFQRKELQTHLAKIDSNVDVIDKILFTEHHHSHAASAFFPSPFDEAVVLTLDGVGEWCTTSTALGTQNKLEIVKEIFFPHSLGLLYSAFTQFLGFRVNSGEYKVMGLAPYGVPKYIDRILEKIIDIKDDGSFKLNMQYFDFCTGLTMINSKFEDVFGLPTRNEAAPLTQEHMDIAASIQAALDHIMLRLTRGLAAEYGRPNLCLAGGVALNCVSNGKILRDGKFKNIWVQPAAGDAGGAIGAALATYHQFLGKGRLPHNGNFDNMSGSYLGPEFSQQEIEERLFAEGAQFEVAADDDALVDIAARAMSEGQAIAWAQGRMEFGPRSLGNRSILADSRSREMQKVLNLKVKYRESFRPFAPSVLAEAAQNWFEIDRESPYMLLVADVIESRRIADTDQRTGLEKLQAPRSEIPAVTHVDYSARIQTVHRETNPLFHKLLTRFNEITGCPVLVNTSFNVRGEPIVCTPEDGFRCLMGTEIDMLVFGRCVLYKNAQNPNLKLDYRDAFDPD